MTPRHPLIIQQRAAEILVVATEALERTAGGAPRRSYVTVGSPTWDGCCDGVIAVDVPQVFQTSQFPEALTTPARCATGWAVEYSVTHLRCAPVLKSTGLSPKVPSGDELTEAAEKLYEDVWAIQGALACYAGVLRDEGIDTMLGPWTPLGPEGGCHGGSQSLTVELPFDFSC